MSESAAATAFPFTEGFQGQIVALMLRDPSFLPTFLDVIDAGYFTFEHFKSIASLSISFFRTYQVAPLRDSLQEAYATYCRKFGTQPDQLIPQWIDRVFAMDLGNYAAVTESVVDFCRRQALRRTMMDMISKVDTGPLDGMGDDVVRALSVGTGTRDMGTLLFQNLDRLPGILNDTFYNKSARVPTGFTTLDTATYGGPGIKQVWVVMAKSGIGKSMFCVNLGTIAIKQGFPVLHITLADLHEPDVMLRYAQRQTGLSSDTIIKNSEDYQRIARAVLRTLPVNPYLRVKYFPAGRADIGTLRSYISQVISQDRIRPRLIIVDYPDKLKGAISDDGKGYAGLGKIYDGLNTIANDFECLVWAPSQVQRWSAKEEGEVIQGDNIQDSKQKIDNCDGAVSLNQTAVEYRQGRARLWIDKVRRGRSKILVPLTVVSEKMLMREAPQ